jgi:glycosyltransferase involved in cell wall biosynthesis
MTTYREESADNLIDALESVLRQTCYPKEVVLVVDGTVAEDQEAAICGFLETAGARLRIVRLQARSGLARALNVGLNHCSCDFVARMDSDDICEPQRLEKQYQFLLHNPNVHLVASWHSEFDAVSLKTTCLKTTPAGHDEIMKLLRWRNAISHPTIMFRKHRVLEVGGYDDGVGLLEDYDLYFKLARAGARFAAIQEPLVRVRTSRRQRRRRGGIRYMLVEWKFNARRLAHGHLSVLEFLAVGVAYSLFRILPSSVKRFLYKAIRTAPPA